MIIQCINCQKKFEVNFSLITENGRNIQCGSCKHTWFYKPPAETSSLINKNIEKSEENIERDIKIEQEDEKISVFEQEDEEIPAFEQDLTKEIKTTQSNKNKKKTGLNLGKILSYFIVVVISFVALIIILDTFKSPLSNKIPSLELILYNLFESLKDIFLFIKDLSV